MRVVVKWSGQKFITEIDPNESPDVFKYQIYSLTGVPPNRMRVLIKGIQLKDTWEKVKPVEDSLFLVIGSAEVAPAPPAEPTVFIEDLPPQVVAEQLHLPSGLENLGNTCYMNSTLQCMNKISELQTYLSEKESFKAFNSNPEHAVLVSLKELFRQMPRAELISPTVFILAFRTAFPMFAQKQQNEFVQQDAEEAWNMLTGLLQRESDTPINDLLGIEFEQTATCEESSESSVSVASDLRIICHISESAVSSLVLCIDASLQQKLEKQSESLGRMATFNVSSKIKKLPKYLSIHFARFFWRQDIKQRVKIRRNISFLPELDMVRHCTLELSNQIMKNREQNGNAGIFELCAVLTHIGVSSESGHYISWVKNDENWFKCDDETIQQVDLATVLRTSGVSADSHIAYMLLYKNKE